MTTTRANQCSNIGFENIYPFHNCPCSQLGLNCAVTTDNEQQLNFFLFSCWTIVWFWATTETHGTSTFYRFRSFLFFTALWEILSTLTSYIFHVWGGRLCVITLPREVMCSRNFLLKNCEFSILIKMQYIQLIRRIQYNFFGK